MLAVRSGVEFYGVNGVSLTDTWNADFRTLHGMHSHGFPNLFLMGGAQGAIAVNYPYVMNIQSDQCVNIVRYCMENKVVRIEVKREAEARWVQTCADKKIDRGDYYQHCTPSYYDGEGRGLDYYGNFYCGGPLQYRSILWNWVSNGDIEADMHLGYAKDAETSRPETAE
jgi:cyclohexanone monooxygenase